MRRRETGQATAGVRVLVAVVLLAFLGALAPGATPAQPRPLDKITLRLDWVVIGNNSMYYLALDKGFYAEEGLDVEIGPGQGSGSTSQVVGGGKDMFGIADVGSTNLRVYA